MVSTRAIVRREATINAGLRAVLEWLIQQRMEFQENMRKMLYHFERRFYSFNVPPRPRQHLPGSLGRYADWSKDHLIRLYELMPFSVNMQSGREYYLPGL